ncbi:MAG: hypothetical protein LC641_02630 [Spirochaeta sp.]|nr:hypothetical protein [Spirochaeta sp.]
MEQINAFLRYRSIPESLKAKINSYYAYLWETRKGYEEAEFVHDLPAALKESVALHLNKEIIERVPLFENANENLIRDIILALEFCDLYQLNKDQFDNVIEHYPAFKHSIQLLAEERRDKVETLRKRETHRPQTSEQRRTLQPSDVYHFTSTC